MWSKGNHKQLSDNPADSASGYSLIEVIVAVSILVVLMALGYRFIVTGFRSATFVQEQQTAIENARQAMNVMTREIRGANNSAIGHYPLSIIEDEEIEFYSDINYDGAFEKVRFYLDGHTLFKVVTQPGPSLDYNQPGVTTTVANYLNNQIDPIFLYFDSDRNETTDIDDIRLVGIILRVNVTPERAPNDYYVETDVHLRNLKDNL